MAGNSARVNKLNHCFQVTSFWMPERRKVFKKGLAVPGHALRAFPVLPSRAASLIAESGNQAPTAAECASEAANEQSVRRGAIRTFGQGETGPFRAHNVRSRHTRFPNWERSITAI